MSFKKQLNYGLAGESFISKWLKARGHSILPAYEKIIDTGKGPQIYTPNGTNLIAPDLLVWKSKEILWVEAKRKTAFTWHRITSRWTTGIDKRHYEHYLKVLNETPWKVWLLFLQEGGHAKDSPENSPSGLFGNDLDFLSKNINHQSDNWGKSGMVYWSIKDDNGKQILKKIATIEEIKKEYN